MSCYPNLLKEFSFKFNRLFNIICLLLTQLQHSMKYAPHKAQAVKIYILVSVFIYIRRNDMNNNNYKDNNNN